MKLKLITISNFYFADFAFRLFENILVIILSECFFVEEQNKFVYCAQIIPEIRGYFQKGYVLVTVKVYDQKKGKKCSLFGRFYIKLCNIILKFGHVF